MLLWVVVALNLALLFAAGEIGISIREHGEQGRLYGTGLAKLCQETQPAAPLLASLAVSPPGAGAKGAGTIPAPPLRAVNGEPTVSETDVPQEASLALRYEPVLKVAKVDRFWPVSVPTVLGLEMGGLHTQFVSP